MSEETKIDVDGVLESLEAIYFDLASDDDGVSSVDCADAIRQLRDELAAERQRADSADAALAESDETWRHNMAEARKTWEADYDQRIAKLTARAENAESAVVAVSEAAQYQRMRADKAEADVLRERQETYRVQLERDAARKAFDAKREECDRLREYSDTMQTINAQQQPEVDRLQLKIVELNQENVRRADEIERLRAERPTMEALLKAELAYLRDHGTNRADIMAQTLAGGCTNCFSHHFAPLAADGNAPISSKSSEDIKLHVAYADRLSHLIYELAKATTDWLSTSHEDMCDRIKSEFLALKAKSLAADGNAPAIPESSEGPRHSCGLSGFNPMLGDKCEACEPTAKSISELCRTSDGMLPADSPPAASAEWVEAAVEAIMGVVRFTNPITKNAIRAALARVGPPKCERCGNRIARLCPQCDAGETFDFTMPQCDHCGKPSTHPVKGDGSNWWFCDECRPPAARGEEERG